MKAPRLWLAANFALALLCAGSLVAQDASITLSGDPQALVVNSAVPGLPPDPVMDEGAAYGIVAVEPSLIEAQLDAPLPPGVAVSLRMEPPPGAVSGGTIELTTSPRVVVASIPAGSYSGLAIRYEMSATVGAGVVPLDTRRVTFTLKSEASTELESK